MSTDASTYHYASAQASHMHEVFVPSILARLGELRPVRVLDLGCGNGSLCRMIKDAGFEVEGADPSEEGVQYARQAHPDIAFTRCGVYDEPPVEWIGQYDVIVSTEVVEHLYEPSALPRLALRLLRSDGVMLVTTPYHGYWKNLAICLLGKWDRHHSPLWNHGHIKFWSKKTLMQLFAGENFQFVSFQGLGRLPWLWMTMLMEFRASGSSVVATKGRQE